MSDSSENTQRMFAIAQSCPPLLIGGQIIANYSHVFVHESGKVGVFFIGENPDDVCPTLIRVLGSPSNAINDAYFQAMKI